MTKQYGKRVILQSSQINKAQNFSPKQIVMQGNIHHKVEMTEMQAKRNTFYQEGSDFGQFRMMTEGDSIERKSIGARVLKQAEKASSPVKVDRMRVDDSHERFNSEVPAVHRKVIQGVSKTQAQGTIIGSKRLSQRSSKHQFNLPST